MIPVWFPHCCDDRHAPHSTWNGPTLLKCFWWASLQVGTGSPGVVAMLGSNSSAEQTCCHVWAVLTWPCPKVHFMSNKTSYVTLKFLASCNYCIAESWQHCSVRMLENEMLISNQRLLFLPAPLLSVLMRSVLHFLWWLFITLKIRLHLARCIVKRLERLINKMQAQLQTSKGFCLML